MAISFHHFDKWCFANIDLAEEVLETQNKAVIVIAGASSSGKSFSAEALKRTLNVHGHRATIISLDQYNFGLSGIIPNKVNLNLFDGSLPNRKEIRNRIKKIIYDVPFDEKYRPEQIDKIRESIKDLVDPSILEKFLKGLYDEWKVLNFDEPTVYDLASAADDVKELYRDGCIAEKKYSKVISEQIPSDSVIDGKQYDVILVEGIYALSKGMLANLSEYDFITDFIDGNPKSLFLRRVIRDEKSTSAGSVFTISIYFKYILKSYKETILPSRKNADVILDNEMSFLELRQGNLYTTKREIHTESEETIQEIRKLGTLNRISYRKDTYFSVPNESRNSNNKRRGG